MKNILLDSSEHPININLFANNCEVSKSNYCPIIHPDEGLLNKHPCENPSGTNIITCKHRDRDIFLKEVNGVALNVPLTSHFCTLPFFFPTLDKSCKNFNASPHTIGVTISDILKNGGLSYSKQTYKAAKKATIKTDFLQHYANNENKILFCSGQDTLIESLWQKRKEYALYEAIKKMGFSIVSGFNFSLFGGECAFSQALNTKRCLFAAYEQEQHGIPSIPNVYALNKYQLQRLITWFKKNPSLNLCTINCQLQDGIIEYRYIVNIITSLLTFLPHLHIIVQGFDSRYLHYLGLHIHRVHVTNKGAVKKAQSKMKLIFDDSVKKLKEEYDPITSLEKLVQHNIKQQEYYFTYLKESITTYVVRNSA